MTRVDGPWRIGRMAMIGSLVMAHIWGTMLVVAVMKGKDISIIGDMFATVGFMIFSTLGVLVGGKAWKDYLPYARPETQKTEEVHRVTTTVSAPDAVAKQE